MQAPCSSGNNLPIDTGHFPPGQFYLLHLTIDGSQELQSWQRGMEVGDNVTNAALIRLLEMPGQNQHLSHDML